MHKEEAILRIAGVEVPDAAVLRTGARVLRGTCVRGSLAGRECVLKVVRGSSARLRSAEATLEALEAAQTSAAGGAGAVVGGLPRVHAHCLASFPDGDRVLCVVMAPVPGSTLAELLAGAVGGPGAGLGGRAGEGDGPDADGGPSAGVGLSGGLGAGGAPRRPRTLAQGLALVAGVALAVRDAASAVPGRVLVHGDVKPSNIVVTRGTAPKVAPRGLPGPWGGAAPVWQGGAADEGLGAEALRPGVSGSLGPHVPTCALVDLDGAVLLDAEGAGGAAAGPGGAGTEGTAVGPGGVRPLCTPGYAAPECLAPAGAAGSAGLLRADVYSLGVVAREVLCGVAPPVGGALGAAPCGVPGGASGDGEAAYVVGARGSVLGAAGCAPGALCCPGVPDDVAAVLQALLAWDPAARPTAAEAAEALFALSHAHGEDGRPLPWA